MSLDNKKKEWVDLAIQKGHSLLEIKKKLQQARYTNKQIDEMLDYYQERIDMYKIDESHDKQSEDEFEQNVHIFLKDNNSNLLSKKEKKEIKSFINNIKKYNKVLSKSIEKIKEELRKFKDNVKDKKKIEKEEEWLKRDIIEQLINSTEIVYIDNPKTNEPISRDNLKKLNIDELIILLEVVLKETERIVNGKE